MPKFNVVRGEARARAGSAEEAPEGKPEKKPANSSGGGWWMLLLGVAAGGLGYHYLLRNAQSFMGGGMNLGGNGGQPQVSGARGRFLAATQVPQAVPQVQYVPVQTHGGPVVMEEVEVLE